MEQRMKQHKSRSMRSLLGLCGFFLMMSSGQGAFAQQAGKTAVAARPVTKLQAQEEEAAKPGSEGIKVHGHWVLQVKNADGTPGERREFENSLVTTATNIVGTPLSTSGAALLAGALSGDVAVGNPAIGFVAGAVASSGTPDIWCNPLVVASTLTPELSCFVFGTTNSLWNLTPQSGSDLAGVSLGLGISVSFYPTVNLILTGNYTVPSGMNQISAVQSLYGACAPKSSPYVAAVGNNTSTLYELNGSNNLVRTADVAPTNCTAANMANSTTDVPVLGALTSTIVTANGVASPLSVTAGQIVTVTVTLSFS